MNIQKGETKNLKVRIISTNKVGIITCLQPTFDNRVLFIIKVGKELIPCERKEFNYINFKKAI